VPPSEPRFEKSLLLLQVGAGAAISVATILAVPKDGSNILIAGAIAPLAVGAAVCAIGNSSDFYRGSYPLTITGAYLGAFISLPLFALGVAVGDHGGDTTDFSTAWVLAGVGWFVLQPTLAVVVWHAGRHLKGEPPIRRPPVPSLDVRLSPGPTRGLSVLPGQLTVPLLALSF
jgi:hypothetical protein